MTRKRVIDEKLSSKQVDELYGLEPVFEPGTDILSGREPTVLASIRCPYCGESYATTLDLSAGSSTYIEDCQVCCQPIDVQVSVGESGELLGMEARRTD